jgi:hypothetical protein
MAAAGVLYGHFCRRIINHPLFAVRMLVAKLDEAMAVPHADPFGPFSGRAVPDFPGATLKLIEDTRLRVLPSGGNAPRSGKDTADPQNTPRSRHVDRSSAGGNVTPRRSPL